MATIKLTKVNIAADKYYTKFNMMGYISTEEIDKSVYNSIQTKKDSIWLGSSANISFATLTGKLADNEYATQLNGFHWVRIKSYAMIKIQPDFISDNNLSQNGIDYIKLHSVAE